MIQLMILCPKVNCMQAAAAMLTSVRFTVLPSDYFLILFPQHPYQLPLS